MSYEAIVIGAGISGAATAYHLQKAGAKTLLLERGEPASGGTGKSAAIMRQKQGERRCRLGPARTLELGHRPLSLGKRLTPQVR